MFTKISIMIKVKSSTITIMEIKHSIHQEYFFEDNSNKVLVLSYHIILFYFILFDDNY